MVTVTSAGEHLHKAIHPLYCAKGSYDGPAIRNLIEAALAQARAEGKAEGMRDGRAAVETALSAERERVRQMMLAGSFEVPTLLQIDDLLVAILAALPSPPADGEIKL